MASFSKEQYIHKITKLEFVDFMYMRQKLYQNRLLGKEKPWSTDEILNKYKFTNIYRELDRTTIYLINKIINNESLSLAHKIFNILVFRIYNQEKLFDDYFRQPLDPDNFKFKEYESQLDQAKKSGKNLFNNAYNITQRTFIDDYRKREKAIQHLLNLDSIVKTGKFKSLFVNIFHAQHPKIIFEEIKSLNFYGSFLSGQCMTDISYIRNFKSEVDFNLFYPVGPGAKSTIESLFGSQRSDDEYSDRCKDLWSSLPELFNELYRQTGKNWHDVRFEGAYYKSYYPSLSNTQNTCCELRKYKNYQCGISCRIKYYKDRI